MAEIEIGMGKAGRRAYGLDDLALVPSRRTRDPEDIDLSWEVDAFRFDLPIMAAAMDSVVSPSSAIAIGQLTPGPLFTIATSVGYIAGGWPGAAAATAGIFLPGLAFVALSGPWIEVLRRSRLAAGFLTGVGAAAVGIMAAVMVPLGADALAGWWQALIALASALALWRTRISSVLVVALGGVAGSIGWIAGWL